MMRSAIISGATSMIASACVQTCLANDMRVTALVRRGTTRMDRLPKHENLRIVPCDLCELASLSLPDDVYDVFFHFAWEGTSQKARRDPVTQQKNIESALHAVRLAARVGCKRFVGAGSQAEYGTLHAPALPDTPANPVIAYGIAKNAARQLCQLECQRLGLSFCWARIFSVYGPFDNEGTLIRSLIEHLQRAEHMPLSSCTQIWDYLYRDDCARAMYLIGQKGRDQAVYCVASGQGRPLKEYVSQIASFFHTDVSQDFGEISARAGQTCYLQGDITSLTKDTGFVPLVDFEKGIAQTIAFYKEFIVT